MLFTDDSRRQQLVRFPMLRQQVVIADDKPNRSLADFVAPAASGLRDYLGAFAVTAGIGAEPLAQRFQADHDDYRAILVKALADRLAEACAEWLHAQVRREWRYGADEHLSSDDLIAERYRGIRPAFGYPACPDHSEKFKLFDLLDATEIGIRLTETGAMFLRRASAGSTSRTRRRSTSSWRSPRPGRRLRGTKGHAVEEVERWLSTNLAYDPARREATVSAR